MGQVRATKKSYWLLKSAQELRPQKGDVRTLSFVPAPHVACSIVFHVDLQATGATGLVCTVPSLSHGGRDNMGFGFRLASLLNKYTRRCGCVFVHWRMELLFGVKMYACIYGCIKTDMYPFLGSEDLFGFPEFETNRTEPSRRSTRWSWGSWAVASRCIPTRAPAEATHCAESSTLWGNMSASTSKSWMEDMNPHHLSRHMGHCLQASQKLPNRGL